MRSWIEKVNGYGAVLRFITPILIAVVGWFTVTLITDIKTTLVEVKADAKTAAVGMINHLEHHRQLEVTLGERLSCIETVLRERLK